MLPTALVIDRSAWFVTVLVMVVVLLARFRSLVLVPTTAVLEIVEALGTVSATIAMMTTVAVSPAAMVPRLPVTVPPASVAVPWLGVADTNVAVAGSVSVRLTLRASDGPLLVIVTV